MAAFLDELIDLRRVVLQPAGGDPDGTLEQDVGLPTCRECVDDAPQDGRDVRLPELFAQGPMGKVVQVAALQGPDQIR
jgi:hypothetical protein